ncbi:endophilin-A3b isoform X2 [Denticeps clupeoides]|uniref:Endophilin-A3-like n=1 Tax=Denticeps clupeoides TaxID=299321 RepID=A0AAY4BS63_9TELE|nr:endophilin-A3-like isoform X2 [Denticeps clupeoides]
MSVAGLKKQFHKASQLLNEKINGAEGTKLDEEFITMERKIGVTSKLLLDLVPRTTEYLQPNPAYRARLGMLNTVSRIRGQAKPASYPQSEGMLGECMLRYGRDLGTASAFGCALVDVGEALKQMGQTRDALDVRVKQSFTEPLQALQERDLKEIGYHLRKMEGRRLDFDYKKRRKGRISDDAIKQALDKFEESRELAGRHMFSLLEKNAEQVCQLSALVEALLDYHRQSCQILGSVHGVLLSRLTTASGRPDRPCTSKSVTGSNGYSRSSTLQISDSSTLQPGGEVKEVMHDNTAGLAILPPRPPSPKITVSDDCDPPLDQPCCRALYNFKADNAGELAFKEGDLIILTNQIDENWYEGMISGESGFFPISYVNVLVPLPQWDQGILTLTH